MTPEQQAAWQQYYQQSYYGQSYYNYQYGAAPTTYYVKPEEHPEEKQGIFYLTIVLFVVGVIFLIAGVFVWPTIAGVKLDSKLGKVGDREYTIVAIACDPCSDVNEKIIIDMVGAERYQGRDGERMYANVTGAEIKKLLAKQWVKRIGVPKS